jgi:type I restriction enzyme S subunit
MSKWEIFKIGDVCKTSSGGTPLKLNNDYYDNGDIPWLVSGEVCQKNILNNKNYITQKGLENSSAKLFPVNTVLVAMYGATAGQVGILRFESATNQAICGILPNKRIIPEFLYYALLFKKSELIAQATGNAQPNISQIKIKNTKIPVPPIEEQKRIVEILDKAFEGIAQAEANTRRNLINARELFDSYLNQVFTNYAHHYNFISLNNLTELITKGSSPKWQGINYVEHPGVLFVTSENVGVNELIFEKTKYVEEKFNKKDSKSILKKGDVLTNIVGASIGRTAIFTREETANINQAVCLIRCLPDKLFNQYICYLLNSPYFRKILHENEVNTARANLSLTFFRNLEIPVPTLEEQKNIVNRISKTIQKTQKLETIYQRKLEAIAELKQSILEKAFTGQLSQ